MDIDTITTYRRARTRADLVLAPGETLLAGGTWLMSEPQPDDDRIRRPHHPRLARPRGDRGRVCASARPARSRVSSSGPGRRRRMPHPAPESWRATSIIPDAANALLASFKIWNTATVGGNVCRSFAAAAMVSLAAALDGIAVVWTTDGGERRVPVAELMTGNGTNSLRARRGAARRRASRARPALPRVAAQDRARRARPIGRCRDRTGRRGRRCRLRRHCRDARAGRAALRRASGTPRPSPPMSTRASGYYTDPLGSADWRRGVSGVLAERIREELAS